MVRSHLEDPVLRDLQDLDRLLHRLRRLIQRFALPSSVPSAGRP
jgi:hypothetical protein